MEAKDNYLLPYNRSSFNLIKVIPRNTQDQMIENTEAQVQQDMILDTDHAANLAMTNQFTIRNFDGALSYSNPFQHSLSPRIAETLIESLKITRQISKDYERKNKTTAPPQVVSKQQVSDFFQEIPLPNAMDLTLNEDSKNQIDLSHQTEQTCPISFHSQLTDKYFQKTENISPRMNVDNLFG